MDNIYDLISIGPRACADSGRPQFYELLGLGDEVWLLVMDIESAELAFERPQGDELFREMLRLVMRTMDLSWEVRRGDGTLTIDVVNAIWFSGAPDGVLVHVQSLGREPARLWAFESVAGSLEGRCRAILGGNFGPTPGYLVPKEIDLMELYHDSIAIEVIDYNSSKVDGTTEEAKSPGTGFRIQVRFDLEKLKADFLRAGV